MTVSSTLFSILVTIFGAVADDECGYTAMGMIASPLHYCSVYSMAETTSVSYSSSYSYDAEGEELIWTYYEDSQCETAYKEYEMDDVMMNIHHMDVADGAGDNCQTVDIRVSGSYSSLTDDCDATMNTDDYYTKSYVINECISSELEQYSAVLLCDAEKIYFNYFQDCTDCNCNMEQYIFEYYADKGTDCYSVQCNVPTSGNNLNYYMSSDIESSASSSNSMIKQIKDAQFIKNIITNTPNTPVLATQIGLFSAKSHLPPQLSISYWFYVMIATCLFVAFCGLCRYINSFEKEYSPI